MGKKIAAGMSDEGPRRPVFSKENIEIITKTLAAFLKNANARCVLLVDKDGHLLIKEGDASSYDADTLAALVSSSFASTRQTARLLGNRDFSVLFHEGKRENLQLSFVGDRTMLGVIFDDKTTLGMVRLYGSVLSAKLTELFNELGGPSSSSA